MSALIGLENAAGEPIVESDCSVCNGSHVVDAAEGPSWCTSCLPALVARAKEHAKYGGIPATRTLDRAVYEHARALKLLE